MGDTDIPVVVNESSWLPGTYDQRAPARPEEEDKEITSYTVGIQGIPTSMGDGIHCLNITFQICLSIVHTTQNFHNKIYMLHVFHFRGQETNSTSSINLTFYEMWVSNKASDWIHWQQCKSETYQVLINIFQGKVID